MSKHDSLPLQTVVQINIYRFAADHFEYLLLKRADDADSFWQPVTEPVPSHGTIAESLRAAAKSQVGISGFRHLSKEIYSYEWYARGERGRDIVFTAEVSPQAVISVDDMRFSDSAWLPANEAIERVKWNGNKEALRRLQARLEDKFRTNPEIFLPPPKPVPAAAQAGDNGEPAGRPSAAASDDLLQPPSVSGRSRRLPDRTEQVTTRETNNPSIGEIFLRM